MSNWGVCKKPDSLKWVNFSSASAPLRYHYRLNLQHYHCHHNHHHKFFANLLVVRVQPGRLKRLVLSQPITSRWGDSYSYVQISALLSAASNIFDGGLSLKSSWGRWENCIWGKLLESLQSWDFFAKNCKNLYFSISPWDGKFWMKI